MSWEDIEIREKGRKSPATAVAIQMRASQGSGGRGGTKLPHAWAVLRPELLAGLPCLAQGQGVKIRLGAGEHAGRIRIESGAATQVRLLPGKYSNRRLIVRLPMMPPDGTKLTVPAEFTVADEGLEIVLPGLLRGAGAAQASVPAQAALQAARTPVAAPAALRVPMVPVEQLPRTNGVERKLTEADRPSVLGTSLRSGRR